MGDDVHGFHDERPIPDPRFRNGEVLKKLEDDLRRLIKSEVNHMTDLLNAHLERIEQHFDMLEERIAEQKKDMKGVLNAELDSIRERIDHGD